MLSDTLYALHLLALGALILLAGRACLEILLSLASDGANIPVLADKNYIALSLGAAVLLLGTISLLQVHLYRFGAIITLLLVIISTTAIFHKPFQRFISRPWIECDATCIVYLALAGTFWLVLSAGTYPLRKETALYLLQGSTLAIDQSSSVIPNYGVLLTEPILYTGHLISAVFGMLSFGNPAEYYLNGQYWLNLLIAPLLPIGAYLLFGRFLPKWAAVFAAIAFCSLTLGVKVWSLRGESLAWILAFAFLIVFVDVVRALKVEAAGPHPIKLFPIVGIIFFALLLTNGVAFIAALFAAIFLLRTLAIHPTATSVRRTAAFVSIAFLLVGALLIGAQHALGTTPMIEAEARAPVGDLDAAILFDNATSGQAIDAAAPKVHAAGPYIPAMAMAAITGTLPLAAIFRPDFARSGLRTFPASLITKLSAISPFEKTIYILLPIACMAFYGLRARRSPSSSQDLFWISIGIYISLIALSLYLDYKSTSLYPIAAIRRSYAYVAFFYCLAIGATMIDVLKKAVGEGADTFYLSRPPSTTRLFLTWPAMLLACSMSIWLVVSVVSATHRPVDLAGIGDLISVRFGMQAAIRAKQHTQSLQPMFDALEYLETHTHPDDWVYANIISTAGSFAFLTRGRNSLLEGTGIYQLYFEQKEAAYRIEQFAKIAVMPEMATFLPKSVHYFLLFKAGVDGPDCQSIECYGDHVITTNLQAFERNSKFRRVFRNDYYDIYFFGTKSSI